MRILEKINDVGNKLVENNEEAVNAPIYDLFKFIITREREEL